MRLSSLRGGRFQGSGTADQTGRGSCPVAGRGATSSTSSDFGSKGVSARGIDVAGGSWGGGGLGAGGFETCVSVPAPVAGAGMGDVDTPSSTETSSPRAARSSRRVPSSAGSDARWPSPPPQSRYFLFGEGVHRPPARFVALSWPRLVPTPRLLVILLLAHRDPLDERPRLRTGRVDVERPACSHRVDELGDAREVPVVGFLRSLVDDLLRERRDNRLVPSAEGRAGQLR